MILEKITKRYLDKIQIKESRFKVMKKLICLLLAGILMIISCSVGCAESVTFPSVAFADSLKMLSDQLLVPSSLDVRNVKTTRLTANGVTYQFWIVHYVAQNKLGGYTDDLAYGLTNAVGFEHGETVMQVGDSILGSDNDQLGGLLSYIISDYLINTQQWSGMHELTPEEITLLLGYFKK